MVFPVDHFGGRTRKALTNAALVELQLDGGWRGIAQSSEAIRLEYPGIDVIRFLSALLVIGFHVGFSVWQDGRRTPFAIPGAVAFPESASAFWFGWVGVEIFFVISGLVIAQSAVGKSCGEFARSRVLRLYPAVWICAPLTALVLLYASTSSPRHIALQLLGSFTLSPVFLPYIDGQYWTLGVEIVFYAVVAATVCARPGNGENGSKSLPER